MLKRKRGEHSLLCLDIGTDAIKCSVFEEIDGVLDLKGYSHLPQQRGNIQRGSIVHLAEVISNVQQAVKKAENMARLSPETMVIGLSGELIKGSTLTLKYDRVKPESMIDAQELKTIIYELQWQAFDQIRSHISDEMSIDEVELKLVNASIISIKVDGELVDDPRGRSGSVVEMEIFNCFAPRQHFGQVQSIAVELPYHKLKGVFIQCFSVCHALTLLNTLESAIVIDIGAGTTDVCVVVDGKIVGNRSFSMAGNSLTKRISFALSTSFDEAEAIKLNYASDQLEKRSQAVIEEALQDDLDIWISSLDFCLKELPIKKLPNKILLCGNASQMREFQEVLEQHDWKHHFPQEGRISVRQLDYADLLPGEGNDSKFSQEYLPLVGVASTAFDLLYNHHSIESILDAVIADRGV